MNRNGRDIRSFILAPLPNQLEININLSFYSSRFIISSLFLSSKAFPLITAMFANHTDIQRTNPQVPNPGCITPGCLLAIHSQINPTKSGFIQKIRPAWEQRLAWQIFRTTATKHTCTDAYLTAQHCRAVQQLLIFRYPLLRIGNSVLQPMCGDPNKCNLTDAQANHCPRLVALLSMNLRRVQSNK